MNILIYRAKKIDSDEYIRGDLIKRGEQYFITIQDCLDFNNGYDLATFVCDNTIFEIDPSTLSVHFPETNIGDLFFGLDNGLGASIIEAVFVDDSSPFKGIAMHSHYGYVFFDKNNDWVHINKLKYIKVIGIQK